MTLVVSTQESQIRRALSMGAAEEAWQLARRAQQQHPEQGLFKFLAGLALLELKRPQEAFAQFTQAIRLNPLSVDVRMALAQAYLSMDDSWSAAAWVSDACRIAPQIPALWLHLARLLHSQRRLAEIEPTLRAALHANAGDLTLNQALAEHLLALRRYADAVGVYATLSQAEPGNARHRLHHGYCLEHLGRLEESIVQYREAVRLQPEFLEAHVDLAGVLWRLGDYQGSLNHAQKSVAIDSEHPYAVRILGTAFLHLNRLEEGEQQLRRALQLKPDFAIAIVDLALLLLLAGRFEEGWQVYGRRWVDTERMNRPTFFRPELEWQGPVRQPLAGKRIVIYAEQGLGDVIQFIRYARLLQQQGAQVACVIQPELIGLVESMPGLVCLKPDTQLSADYHVALLDLPMHLGCTLADIPAIPRYLQAPPDRVAMWAERMRPWAGKVRIGLAWAGHAIHPNHHNRCMPLSEFRDLLREPGVQCFSLQKSDGERYTDLAFDEDSLVDFTSEWTGFADSAAQIEQLDLVICIDSAVAHLAAALGKPTWLLLPPNPDWRWLLGRDDSPWYPSMRLFRRSYTDSRSQQMARVLAALRKHLRAEAGAQLSLLGTN